jgi:hypothetical protein
MAKSWHMQCGPNNQCWAGSSTQWCETFPDGCQSGDVGDLQIEGLAPDELKAKLNASTTKFVLDKDRRLLEAGMLEKAGLEIGDTLLSIQGFRLSHKSEKQIALKWKFESPQITVLYLRNSQKRVGRMENPKGK